MGAPTFTPDRQRFRQVLAELAEKARMTLPPSAVTAAISSDHIVERTDRTFVHSELSTSRARTTSVASAPPTCRTSVAAVIAPSRGTAH